MEHDPQRRRIVDTASMRPVPLTKAQTALVHTRVKLMIEITAKDGKYRKGLAVAVKHLSPQEAAIIADLEAHGMQVPQLRDVLRGGHVLIDNPDLYEAWRFPDVSHRRISSHHRDVDKAKYPDVGMRGSVVREKLHGRTSEGTWVQLEKTPAAFGSKKLPTMDDLRHLWDFIVYRITRSNVGPWGLSRVTERRPLYLSPKLSVGASVSGPVAAALAMTFARIDEAEDAVLAASQDLALRFPPPTLTDPLAEIRPDADDRTGRGLFGNSQVWITETPSRIALELLQQSPAATTGGSS